jgi:type II secretory pathway component PulF
VKFFETYVSFLAQYMAIATMVILCGAVAVFFIRRHFRRKKTVLQATLVTPITSTAAHVAETAAGAVKSGTPAVERLATQGKVLIGDALNRADPPVRRGLEAGKLLVGNLASRGAQAWSRYRQK